MVFLILLEKILTQRDALGILIVYLPCNLSIMNWLPYPLHHHAKKVVHHVKSHHKKYLFAGSMFAAFFAITKIMVLFATSFALFSTSHDTSYADILPIDTIVEETGTGSVVDTSAYDPAADLSLLANLTSPIESTWVVSTWVEDTSLDQTLLLSLMLQSVWDTLGWSELSGTLYSGTTFSWDILSWDILSWDTLSLPLLSWDILSWNNTPDTSDLADTGIQYYENLLANQIVYCHTWDVIMSTLLSGQTFAGLTSFQWVYSGWCLVDNISFQLYDHNNQWIEISTFSGSNLWFSFDSKFLYTWGWYSTTGLNASGLIYTIDSGLYLGVPSLFATWYKVRLLNTDGHILYQSSGFTIDNLPPTLTGFSFVYYTWENNSWEVHFLFSWSELLDSIQISLSSGRTSSRVVSWLSYDYLLRGFDAGFSGNISYSISYSDLWGNTSVTSGVWFLSFSGLKTLKIYTWSILTLMKEEIDKFNACKNDLKFKVVSFDVGGNTLTLNMPAFKKTEVRKLISAFSYFVIKKLDTTPSIDQLELDALTKVYNNFLVVLKLVSDDDNNCEQNLGNYYRWLFTTTLERYGITDL